MHFFIEYCHLPCNIVVSLFMLLAALFHLKPKVHNVATISAFTLFLLHVFTHGQSIGCMVLSLYYLMVMWKLIQDPGIILVSLFQSASGT